MSQNYKLLEKVIADGDIPIYRYVNKVNGLRIVLAEVECPIVKGDLVFATEAFDDDGLPHTLEHLIFLGSESYPYKGVLDILANKCLSSGTNAMTDTDYTNYTLSTAGSEGFLNLLPVYLDHVLFPTLTDSAYCTEVHHINGAGEDAGVVYCEMQSIENKGETRCYVEMLRSMYPGVCGYKSVTGGLMSNLRNSTSNQKVQEYHRNFYHTNNLCVIVTGAVEIGAILKAIKPIEDKILAKGLHKMQFTRPWQAPVQPLTNSVERVIQYSSDTDDDGLVLIGYRGPNAVKNFKELVALTILLDYLNSTAISPIQRDFVECSEPLCSGVSHDVIENSTSCIYLTFESVSKEYMDKISTKLQELLKNIHSKKESFDMERLQIILARKVVKILSGAETSPHAIVVSSVIGHFLYGDGNLAQRCQEISLIEEFKKQDTQFWLNLIEEYMIGPNARYVCIVGKPSPTEMRSQSEAEEKRLDQQKKVLEEHLPVMAEKLRNAIEANERPPPSDILNNVKIPSLDSVRFHQIERIELDPKVTPFRIQCDSIKTNFVTIQVLADTSHTMTKQDRLYLPLLSEIILESPILRDNVVVPYEKVVAELFSDTVDTSTGIGLSSGSSFSTGTFSMLFNVSMQVEMSKYDRAVKWYREIFYSTIFTAERIKTTATRMASDISQYKRSGSKVMSTAIMGLLYQSNSNQWATNFLRQQKFLQKLLKDLKNKPERIEKDMTRIRDVLTNPDNMFVHLTFNKNKMDARKMHEPWIEMVPKEIIQASSGSHIKLKSIIPCHKLIKFAKKPKMGIIGVGSVESNFMRLVVKSIDSAKHPDLPAIQVLIQYLTQLEGPLWRQIRGLGLSYHYSIELSSSNGLISFLLYKANQIVTAYDKAVEVVYQHISDKNQFEDALFESAKSSLMYQLIAREKSPAHKSLQSLLAHLRDVDLDFNRDFIQSIAKVTKEDLQRVGPLYLKPLFEDQSRRSVVCCHPSTVEKVTKGLGLSGIKLDKISLEDSFLNSFE